MSTPSKPLIWTEGQSDWWGSTGNKPDDTAVWYTIAQRQLTPSAPTLYYLLRGFHGDPEAIMVTNPPMGAYKELGVAMEAAQVDHDAIYS